ncbi:MAG: guanosine monophosphate reductase [Bdellovibrionales bacterium]|nr:guanosine monophosphate reductase [Bdellovibrionales bacterium]
MELLFDHSGLTRRGKGYTYDDVLIVPARSEMRSRRDPDLTSSLTKTRKLKLPFISANMDTITEAPMAIAMDQQGGFGIIHRFMSIQDQVNQVQMVKDSGAVTIGASIGVNDDSKDRAQALVTAGANVLTVDIAHGHSVQMFETLAWLKDHFSNIEVIAGNVATPEGTMDLIEAGADAIKVGIGPGSMCTTRIITGCGVPQLTAVAMCAEVATSKKVPIIADGGIKTSGDIVKAFAAGASTVMLGSILAGTIETPGLIQHGQKQYRGMASRAAQDSWRGGVPLGMAPEGEATKVFVKGHLSDVVGELAGGLRSGMTYINANELSEIAKKARFMEMTAMGYRESSAHGVRG